MNVVCLAPAHRKPSGGEVTHPPLDSELPKNRAVSAFFTPHFQSLVCQAHRHLDIY